MPKHREQSRRSRPEKSEYEKLAKIGQGSFGEVFKARDKKTKDVVALKKVLMDNEKRKLPFTTWREIRLLQLMKHDNIVNLLEVCGIKGSESFFSLLSVRRSMKDFLDTFSRTSVGTICWLCQPVWCIRRLV